MRTHTLAVFFLTISLVVLMIVVLGNEAFAKGGIPTITMDSDYSTVALEKPIQHAEQNPQILHSKQGQTTPEFTSVVISGTLAYTGFGSGLSVFDIVDPTMPNPLANITLSHADEIQDVVIQGDYLYVAADSRIYVISISDPSNPLEIGYTEEITSVTNIAVTRDYLYTAGNNHSIVSITDPTSPTLLGTYPHLGWSRNIDIQGDHLYLATDLFKIFSIVTPTVPSLLGSINVGTAYDVDVEGDFAYIANFLDGLKIVSVTTPTTPTIVSGVSTGSIATHVQVSGQYAYVCAWHYALDGRSYFHIVSITDPVTPTVIGSLLLPGGCNDIDVDNNHAYVSNRDGLRVVSISDPQHPVEVGRYPVLPDDVLISGLTTGGINTAHTFTATVYPVTVTTPITYMWQTTEHLSLIRLGSVTDSISFTWSTDGLQVITVTAMNLGRIVTDTHTILITTNPQTYTVYLPAALRNYGGCSAVPTLLSPANLSSLDTIIPLFEWDNGNNLNATTLRLQVAKDANFTQHVNSLWSGGSPGIHEFRFSRNFDPATTYYWRAWLMCGDVQGQYSEVRSFTTGSNGTILTAPALVAPANGSVLPSLPQTLQWLSVNGAEEYLVHWRKVGEGEGYSYSWRTETQMAIDWILSADTTYEWWVSARNSYAIGVDSAKWQFTTPAQVSSLSPENLNHSIIVEEDGITNILRDYR